ncbi:unnamed protein product [Strongylus vulgaris]|uniref:Uncharacterized protein n=1 Tax=Strongylus vulgaris TaxID=40348 RepID=A0A3P7IVU0_STRVU|nr:unnamed protein product [Strongylus vulgaris]
MDPIARRDIWKLITSTQLNDRVLVFKSSSIEECEKLGTRYGVYWAGRFVSTGTIDVLKGHHTRLCLLQCELSEKALKQKVLDTVHDLFAQSVPLPIPDEDKLVLKWHVPMAEGDTMSAFFRKVERLPTFVPVTNLRFTHASSEDAFTIFGDKFSNLQRKASKMELVNQLLTVVQ